MSDNIIQFKLKEIKEVDEAPYVPLEGGGTVVGLTDEHVGRFNIPQPDGTLRPIQFPISELDWWTLIAIRTCSRNVAMNSDPLLYINTDPHIHEQGSWMNRRRSAELIISKQTMLSLAEAIPFILTSSFNGDMPDDLYMQLSEMTAEHRILEDEPEYTEAMIVHPIGQDGEQFKLIWVEV
ncbi:hypothetical protein MLDJOKPK_00210 [Salmonella phage SPAsTU]|nr:hypothetical protein STsAS_200 [Salmonella phage STsAS]AWN09122.1 hypothetical protein MLDJOKPK_00210 [Salmonella phage SPAsTU]